MFSRSPNINQNSAESKFSINPKVALTFGILTAIPQLFIVWATWYLGASDLLFSWVIFSLAFSDIILIALAAYLFRVYLREDAQDWMIGMSNLIINTNTTPHLIGLASRMLNTARAEQKQEPQNNWDDIVKVDMDLGNGTDSEFE